MKLFRALILLLTIQFFLFKNVVAQEADKKVSITVSGSGKTQDDAKQSAFRSAIEQAFGAFISAKTEILNDKIISDQITSVANGNIQSFDLLNEAQLPDGSWGVTLKVSVSVSKLTSFVAAKGVAIEIKGGMFALNIKQQLLNEQGEIKAVSEMVGLLHEPMQTSFDYVIKSSDPKSLDADSENWEIPLEVSASANNNMDFCADYCIKTLAALSLSVEEVTSYQSLNKAVFPVVIKYNGVAKTFYLRKEISLNVLNGFTNQWQFYIRSFTVHSGLDESNGLELFNNVALLTEDVNSTILPLIRNGHVFSTSGSYYDWDKEGDAKTINFLKMGQIAGVFIWLDKRTLAQIGKMTSYKVKPREVNSQFKHGGFLIYEKNGHGLVASITDFRKVYDWSSVEIACKKLVMNGFSDWRLPSEVELNAININLHRLSNNDRFYIHGLYPYKYKDLSSSWFQAFGLDLQESNNSAHVGFLRAVREF